VGRREGGEAARGAACSGQKEEAVVEWRGRGQKLGDWNWKRAARTEELTDDSVMRACHYCL